MTHFDTTSRALLITLVALLAAASVYVVTLIFIRSERSATAAAMAELSLAVERERRGKDMARLLADLDSESGDLASYFADKDSAADVVAMLEELGRHSGAEVRISSVGFVQHAAPEDTLAVHLAAQGPWPSVTHLLSLAESLPLQSQITALSLDAAGAEGTSTAARWSVTASLEFGIIDQQ